MPVLLAGYMFTKKKVKYKTLNLKKLSKYVFFCLKNNKVKNDAMEQNDLLIVLVLIIL